MIIEIIRIIFDIIGVAIILYLFINDNKNKSESKEINKETNIDKDKIINTQYKIIEEQKDQIDMILKFLNDNICKVQQEEQEFINQNAYNDIDTTVKCKVINFISEPKQIMIPASDLYREYETINSKVKALNIIIHHTCANNNIYNYNPFHEIDAIEDYIKKEEIKRNGNV